MLTATTSTRQRTSAGTDMGLYPFDRPQLAALILSPTPHRTKLRFYSFVYLIVCLIIYSLTFAEMQPTYKTNVFPQTARNLLNRYHPAPTAPLCASGYKFPIFLFCFSTLARSTFCGPQANLPHKSALANRNKLTPPHKLFYIRRLRHLTFYYLL